MRYHIGQSLRLVGKFTDYDGTAASPTTAVLRVLDPSGNESTPSVTANTNPETEAGETGTYYGEVIPDESGRWRWRWEGDGTIEATDEGSFFVEESEFSSPD